MHTIHFSASSLLTASLTHQIAGARGDVIVHCIVVGPNRDRDVLMVLVDPSLHIYASCRTMIEIVELPTFGEPVRINVGGCVFETTFSTLTRVYGSLFAAMAKHGRIQNGLFIDRDPTHFGKVLNYLRDSESFCPPEDDETRACLISEAMFYKLPGLAEMCLRTDFQVGNTVKWKESAIEIYWKFFVRYQYHERQWARCMACGDNVFGYVGPTTTENKETADEVPIKFDDWVPLQYHMQFMKGNVTEVSNSCCGVKWDAWETHLPKSALKKTH